MVIARQQQHSAELIAEEWNGKRTYFGANLYHAVAKRQDNKQQIATGRRQKDPDGGSFHHCVIPP